MKKAFSLIELSIVILIAGILITGVMQGSKLIKKFRLNNARTLTQNSPVVRINGLSAWWEATSVDSFENEDIGDESTIGTWKDINPRAINKADVTQSAAGYQPSYDSEGMGGLPAVKFDGSNDVLIGSNNPPIDSENFTFFAAVKTADTTGYTTIFDNNYFFPGDGYKGYSLYIKGSTNSFHAIISTETIDLGTDATLEQIQITTYKYDGSLIKFYESGTEDYESSFSGFIPNNNSSSSFSIGAYTSLTNYENDDHDYHFNGHIGEIIIFNRALKNEERESVEKYLGKKWGVEIN